MRKRILVIVAAFTLAIGFVAIHPGKALAYDPNDPYDSGCANNAQPVNSGHMYDTIHGFWVADIYNWYSYSCNKNWVIVYYNTGAVTNGIQIDIHRQYGIGDPVGSTHQCWPTDCRSHYYGRLSPTWTDMVNGSNYDCILVDLLVGDEELNTYPLNLYPHPDPAHPEDAICA